MTAWEQWETHSAQAFPRQPARAKALRGLGRVGTVLKSPMTCACVCVRDLCCVVLCVCISRIRRFQKLFPLFPKSGKL